MDEFELELKQALERRPAPPSLQRKIMERRRAIVATRSHNHSVLWMRLAASLLIAAILGGAAEFGWQRLEERRRGEEARRQVMTALRITSHALNEVHEKLAHDRAKGD